MMLTQQLRFIYHLKTSVGVKYVFEDDLTRWLSIRTWGEKVFIASGPSSVHVFSHNGADLSLTYVINPYGSLPPEWHGFVRTTGNRYLFDRHQTNFLPHPRNPDGVFIVLAGTTLESELDDGAFFLVREFNGTTHVATYSCDVWENMVAAMEAVFNQDDNKSAQQELEAAMSRMEVWDFDWGSIHDEWPGSFGGDEGVYEVFRFAFNSKNLAGPGQPPRFGWGIHQQISVTFCTTTKQWGAQGALIDDGEDGLFNTDWASRGSMLRNNQLVRMNYNKDGVLGLRPTITTRDINLIVGEERTRTELGKRNDLYLLEHENKGRPKPRAVGNHRRFSHDEDFTVMWDRFCGDCVVFDFRE